MNDRSNHLHQVPDSRSEELVKHQLNVPGASPASPDIDHWVLQLWGVAPGHINDPALLSAMLGNVVEQLDLTRVSEHSHFFGPGVSTVVILSESHLSAHTWPELGYMHIDLLTCVKKLTSARLEFVFRHTFAPRDVRLAQLEY